MFVLSTTQEHYANYKFSIVIGSPRAYISHVFGTR